jgi:protein-S-isoprenylcysteine O-methyltransferase Ste14
MRKKNQTTLSLGRVIASILSLPFMVTVVIPLVLLLQTRGYKFGWKLPNPYNFLTTTGGIFLIVLGLILLGWTISLFTKVGRGTLSPWDPTEKLVIQGPYRHVRNPMILGVYLIVLGESLLLFVPSIFLWFLLFVAINLIYTPLVEERGLETRFGEVYQRYKRNVPAWIPRLKPWKLDD